MSLADDLAQARKRVPPPTRAELIEEARYMVTHPDAGKDFKHTVKALLDEIDVGKQRLDVAIRYAARLLQRLSPGDPT